MRYGRRALRCCCGCGWGQRCSKAVGRWAARHRLVLLWALHSSIVYLPACLACCRQARAARPPACLCLPLHTLETALSLTFHSAHHTLPVRPTTLLSSQVQAQGELRQAQGRIPAHVHR